MNAFAGARQEFALGGGGRGGSLFAAAPRAGGPGRHLAPARLPPHRARVGAAQLRRQARQGGGRPRAGRLEAQRRADGRDPVRRRAHRPAGLHRRAAARRSRGHALGRRAPAARTPKVIEPLVPVDLVVDHSVQVDFWSTPRRAAAATWRSSSSATARATSSSSGACRRFDGFKVVPPGIGIVHQVNLEYLAQGVLARRTASSIPTRSSAPTRTPP